MAHIAGNKKKILDRLSRIQGQLHAVAKAVEEGEQESSKVLLTLAASRGAIQSLLAEIIEGHIRHHVWNPEERPSSERSVATQELIDVVQAYFK
ncbi:MAG TPA: metal/formaldehyde-sensitive transcriptional repressor [Myxococcales bacterium]|jgi:FrmR/RcnR family transcriptional regulator, repressor of frmRAB operon|nr:metal/formaldehyde-sensitive transcriptional repressor [Myxococcales bacterium]